MSSSNSTVTDETLFAWGQSICRMTLSHGSGWLFYGIYLPIFFSYLSPPRHSRSFTLNRILQTAMILLFLSSTLQFITDFIFSIAQIQGYMMSTRFPLADRKDDWENTHLPFYVIQRWPPAINFIVSDLIVLWRAASLRQSHRWLKVAMGTLGVADVVVWCVAAAFTSRDAAQRSSNRATDQVVNTVSIITSLAINVIGTIAIAVVAWKHHRTMNQAAITRWRGDVPRILLVLVESGVVWALIQILYVVLEDVDLVPGSPLDMGTGALLKMAVYLAAILPTLTLIIIRSKRSVEDPGISEISSTAVCSRCSNIVIVSGSRAQGTRSGDAVRLTMMPSSPRAGEHSANWGKARFGRDAGVDTIQMGTLDIRVEEETHVSKD
ncbi:hypothetical protein FB45DRAFT_1051152 [Roridomyces roridus]|uniref:Uncharacterized protein n=1 Tax=Roridomyces roridus TaxID=1738132 RepID=A0AAD7CNN5_9AGAR|nr:hypothetical protein FB45DRAFT_1051152 [Roridomyces roridus]